MKTTAPSTVKIGWYHSCCCLLDTYRISTEQELAEALENLANEADEPMGFRVFPTIDAVLAAFGGELSPEQEAAEINRLQLAG